MEPAKEGVLKCQLCTISFEKLKCLREHYLIAHEKYLCEFQTRRIKECEELFTSIILFRTHLVQVHRRVLCEKCDRTYTSESDKNRHFRSKHLKLRPQCPKCGKLFANIGSMHRHERTVCNPDHLDNTDSNQIKFPKRKLNTDNAPPKPSTSGSSTLDTVRVNLIPQKKQKETNLESEEDNSNDAGISNNLFDSIEVFEVLGSENSLDQPDIEGCTETENEDGTDIIMEDHAPKETPKSTISTKAVSNSTSSVSSTPAPLKSSTPTPRLELAARINKTQDIVTAMSEETTLPVIPEPPPPKSVKNTSSAEDKQERRYSDRLSSKAVDFVLDQWFAGSTNPAVFEGIKNEIVKNEDFFVFLAGLTKHDDMDYATKVLKNPENDVYLQCIRAFYLLEFAVAYTDMNLPKLFLMEETLTKANVDKYYLNVVLNLIRFSVVKYKKEKLAFDYIPFVFKLLSILPSQVYNHSIGKDEDESLLVCYQDSVQKDLSKEIMSVLVKNRNKASSHILCILDKVLSIWIQSVLVFNKRVSFFNGIVKYTRRLGMGTVKIPCDGTQRGSGIEEEKVHKELIEMHGISVEKFNRICLELPPNLIKTFIRMIYSFPKPDIDVYINYRIAMALERSDALQILYLGSDVRYDKKIMWRFESELERATILIKFAQEEQFSICIKETFALVEHVEEVFKTLNDYELVRKVFASPEFKLGQDDRFEVLLKFCARKCGVDFNEYVLPNVDFAKLQAEFKKVVDLLDLNELKRYKSKNNFTTTFSLFSQMV